MSGSNPYNRPNAYGAPSAQPPQYGQQYAQPQQGHPQQPYGQPGYPPPGYGAMAMQPHRASTVKLLAWIGFFMWILALIALIFANQDLAAMRQGRMDPSGYAETESGKKVAIGMLIFHACMIPLGIVAYVAIMMATMGSGSHHPTFR